MQDSLESKAAPTPLDIASDRLHTAFPTALGQAVRAALERVIASPDFLASDRNRRFLRFVVEAALEGRRHEMVGKVIAKKIFLRGEDFRSAKDPIVRIEAGRLRRDLETYYFKSGRTDEIVIALPKGHYYPHFARRQTRASSPALSAGALTIASFRLANAPLEALQPPIRARLADELLRRHQLAVFIAPEPAVALLDSESVRLAARRDGAAYVLSGDARSEDGCFSIVARLHDGATGQLMWSEEFFGPHELSG
ncbi:MAG: hypothetical protein WCI38_05895, partial [Chthoniobacterales bacterium]